MNIFSINPSAVKNNNNKILLLFSGAPNFCPSKCMPNLDFKPKNERVKFEIKLAVCTLFETLAI